MQVLSTGLAPIWSCCRRMSSPHSEFICCRAVFHLDAVYLGWSWETVVTKKYKKPIGQSACSKIFNHMQYSSPKMSTAKSGLVAGTGLRLVNQPVWGPVEWMDPPSSQGPSLMIQNFTFHPENSGIIWNLAIYSSNGSSQTTNNITIYNPTERLKPLSQQRMSFSSKFRSFFRHDMVAVEGSRSLCPTATYANFLAANSLV